MNFSSVQEVRIERVIERWSSGTLTAEFFRDDKYFLCRAWIDCDGTIGFEPRHDQVNTLEIAGQVRIALQMAIEWTSGELANHAILPR